MAYSITNPFAQRAASYQAQADRLATPSAHDTAMAQMFPTGAGFGYGSRRARDRKMDSTINKACKSVEASQKARHYKALADAYERGEVNAQGRSIDAGTKARAEKREAGQGRSKAKQAAEGFNTRKINGDLNMNGSSALADGRVVSMEIDFSKPAPDGGYRYKVTTPGAPDQHSKFYSCIARMTDSGELRKLLLTKVTQ